MFSRAISGKHFAPKRSIIMIFTCQMRGLTPGEILPGYRTEGTPPYRPHQRQESRRKKTKLTNLQRSALRATRARKISNREANRVGYCPKSDGPDKMNNSPY